MTNSNRTLELTPTSIMTTCGVLAAILSIVLTAGGCASSDTDDAAARWAREVRVMTPEQVSASGRDYEELGFLEERGMIGTMGEEGARRDAERNLRYRAAKLDADAVVIIGCSRATDRQSQLSPELVCQAVAIRWLAP
jgi:hypothetical protein